MQGECDVTVEGRVKGWIICSGPWRALSVTPWVTKQRLTSFQPMCSNVCNNQLSEEHRSAGELTAGTHRRGRKEAGQADIADGELWAKSSSLSYLHCQGHRNAWEQPSSGIPALEIPEFR